jgi:hypothetical protein
MHRARVELKVLPKRLPQWCVFASNITIHPFSIGLVFMPPSLYQRLWGIMMSFIVPSCRWRCVEYRSPTFL